MRKVLGGAEGEGEWRGDLGEREWGRGLANGKGEREGRGFECTSALAWRRNAVPVVTHFSFV